MAKLTTQEKADRYDALQVAIKVNIDTYESRKQDAQSRYNKNTICDRVDLIAAYSKGKADAYADMITTLTAFTN